MLFAVPHALDPWANEFINKYWWSIVAFIVIMSAITLLLFFTRKKEKKMGGLNESVLDPDEGKKKRRKDGAADAASPSMGGGTVLAPDYTPPANTAPPPPLQPQHHVEPAPGFGVPIQTQAIRQHMNAGQVHLHVDGAAPLKTAVPVAEWYVIMRHLRSLAPFTFVDTENNTVAYFRPYIHGGLFEVAIELAPIHVGPRVTEMTAVTNTRR